MGINLSADFRASSQESDIGRLQYEGQSTRPTVNNGPDENIAVFSRLQMDKEHNVSRLKIELNAYEMNDMLTRLEGKNYPWSDRNRETLHHGLDQTIAAITKRGGDPVAELVENPNTDRVGDLIDKYVNDKTQASSTPQPRQPQPLLPPNF